MGRFTLIFKQIETQSTSQTPFLGRGLARKKKKKEKSKMSMKKEPTKHCFLTHDWGQDHANHKRVARINELLKAEGFITWYARVSSCFVLGRRPLPRFLFVEESIVLIGALLNL
jgi:hypothetical protein